MSTGIFGIGITGMQAAQLGLMTTEHNISNASTPGYSRQSIVQAPNLPIMLSTGAVGQGTHVSTIARSYDQFLTGQMNSSQASVSELDTYYAQIKQIDNMVADPASGLSPALQDFFKGVQSVASSPSSIPARQTMISSAQSLVSRFQSIDSRLDELANGVNGQIVSTVESVNSYTQQIAKLNQRITLAQSVNKQPANDLLDQRDQLVNDLNKLIKVSTITDSDGSYSVFINNGEQLVIGQQASTMTATASQADPSRIVVGLNITGRAQELPESIISGGQLGGLVRFRSESLDRATNEMGRVAASLAMTFNTQNGLGQDLIGQAVGSGLIADFFNTENMQPSAIGNDANTGNGVIKAKFVVAGAYTLGNDGGSYTLKRQSDGKTWSDSDLGSLQNAVAGEGVNLSGVSVTAGQSTAVYSSTATTPNFFTNLTTSDYRLSYDGAAYSMTRLSDNKQWSDASLDTLSSNFSASEGFAFDLTAGAMKANDSFLIQPTRGAAGNIAINATIVADPRLIAAASPFRTEAPITNTGTGKISNGQAVAGYASTSAALGASITYSGGELSNFPADFLVTLPDGTSTFHSAGDSVPYNDAKGIKISLAGVSFEISGQPADGDTFKISANASGAADGRNALLLGRLQSQSTMVGGTANYQGAYAQFVSNNGNKTQEARVTGEAQQALLEQAQGARDTLSGVNLDEEAANLLRYQQAYQAAAKMLDVGSKLFDAILSIR